MKRNERNLPPSIAIARFSSRKANIIFTITTPRIWNQGMKENERQFPKERILFFFTRKRHIFFPDIFLMVGFANDKIRGKERVSSCSLSRIVHARDEDERWMALEARQVGHGSRKGRYPFSVVLNPIKTLFSRFSSATSHPSITSVRPSSTVQWGGNNNLIYKFSRSKEVWLTSSSPRIVDEKLYFLRKDRLSLCLSLSWSFDRIKN